MTTRLATFEDIPALNELITLSVRGLSKAYYTTQQIESALRYIFGIDSQLVTDGTYYLVQIDGTIAGCGGWSKRSSLYGADQYKAIEDPLLEPSKDAARIRAFFVHPAYARRGIGRHLINLCEKAAQAYGFSFFELGATLPGVPLYTAMGYKIIEQVDAQLPDGVVLEIAKMKKHR